MASRRLVLGTGVYLLPLRHPTPIAKQVAACVINESRPHAIERFAAEVLPLIADLRRSA